MSEELELFDPVAGELIDPHDMPRVAEAITRIRIVKQQLNDALNALTFAVREEAQRVGTKTIHAGEATLELSPGYETVWDHEELEKLLDAGLPQDRYEALMNITVTYKVDGRVAKQIASANERYKEIIEAAQTQTPKSQYVKIKRSY